LINRKMTRRTFAGSLAASAVAAATPKSLFAARKRNIHIGHTGITWVNSDVDQAIQDVGKQGFYGFETFGQVLVSEEPKGGLGRILDANHLPLISAYCTLNLTDPSKRKDQMALAATWAGLIKKYNGRIFVLGPNQVDRRTYKYEDHKANIISTLNEAAKVVTDHGITPVLHPHTGTCIIDGNETYTTLATADTRYLKFGPDVGQLTKGGENALQVVKDHLALVEHMHLKDYNGKDPHLLGYCPLGQGEVNIPGILDLMEGRKIKGMVMVELDNDPRDPSPIPPIKLVEESKAYLETIGVKFRT